MSGRGRPIFLPSNIGTRFNSIRSSGGEQNAVWNVEQIGESKFVAGDILLLGQDLVVDVKSLLEVGNQRIESVLVGSQAEHPADSSVASKRLEGKMGNIRLEDVLEDSCRCIDIEVALLHRRCLLEDAFGLEVLGDKTRALIGVFLRNVSGDGTALVDNVPVVILLQSKIEYLN